ncbi:hypothetical protein LTR36_001976 [Oleoguttula mirabilis]|uniref:F-box domain-containing protein n=1 Tax=Oleoguttula mirabilis TaxID=1507867 RepID=A0AAV9JM17_9PEZI|nr:hypothetical protein LTR36_001976 [Oleoguttula mirabilis]
MDHSPLARLPAELRDDIYERALHQDWPIRAPWYPKETVGVDIDTIIDTAAYSEQAVALTRTCKQIRRESLGLFYSTNIFHITLSNIPLFWEPDEEVEEPNVEVKGERVLVPLWTWLNAIKLEHASLLNSVVVQLGYRKLPLHEDDFAEGDNRELVAAVLHRLRDWSRSAPRRRMTVNMPIQFGWGFEPTLLLRVEFPHAAQGIRQVPWQLSDCVGNGWGEGELRVARETVKVWQEAVFPDSAQQ